MLLSVTEAAKVAGCARSTIYEKINAGQLSRSAGGKIDTAELQRVFGELQTPGLQQSNDTPDKPDTMASELLDMVQARDSELAEIRSELDETKERLAEHREAARALIDPETFEQKQAELKAEIERVKTESDTKLQQQQAELKTRESDWQKAFAERRQEVEQARAEADNIRQSEQQAKARADEILQQQRQTQRQLEAMQNRGLIDRLLNRKPVAN